VITAENITDEQIRELRLSLPLFGQNDVEVICVAALFPVALLADLGYDEESARTGVAKARARCAEILEARRKEGK
jgi:hypothetical protein